MSFFKKVKQVIREIDDNPELYNAAARLLDEVREITASAKKSALYTKGTQDSLKQLQVKLTDALRAFDSSRSIIGFQVFAEACHTAIYDHQPKLMAAPGLWNQLKALFNNFLERYFNVEPCFDTNKSKLAIKDEFRQSFDKTKDELSMLIEKSENNSSTNCFGC